MNRILKMAVAMIALASMATSAVAQEPCVPLEPKKLEGSIEFVPPVRKSVAATYFQDNACTWNGNDQLNGTDAFVFDVTGIEGPATITVNVDVGLQDSFEGILLDEACAQVGDLIPFGSGQAEFPDPYVIDIAKGAKWMIVQPGTSSPATTSVAQSVQITLESAGKKCEVQQPPEKEKKKKKKKKKRN